MVTVHAESYTAHWVLTPGQPPRQAMGVVINRDTGRIDHLYSVAAAEVAQPAEGTYILTPGLINAHTHLELYAGQPIPKAPGESMGDWLLKVIGYSRSLDDAGRKQACHKSIVELVRSGTTCVNDITSGGASLEALSEVGMRGVVSPEFFYPMHDEDPWVREIVERFETLCNRFAAHPLLSIGVSPHSPYNVTPQAYKKVIECVDPAIVHTHTAETRDEIQWFKTGTSSLDKVHERVLGQVYGPAILGRGPLDALVPYLTEKWVLVHGVYLSEQDREQLARTGASLVHCPRSNLWLSGETLTDLRQYEAAGIPVGLGTDSRLSAPDLDLRAEGRVARSCHGLSAQETFELMTSGSARAIKQAQLLGRLAPGYAADLVLWHHPASGIDDPWEAWLSPETQVEMVVINGRIVLERCLS